MSPDRTILELAPRIVALLDRVSAMFEYTGSPLGMEARAILREIAEAKS